jgi:hypothetical protein
VDKPQFTWRKWKLGLAVAIMLSLFVAGSGLDSSWNWMSFVRVFCIACLTHMGAFLKTHPIEDITDTRTVTKTDVQQTTVVTSATPKP